MKKILLGTSAVVGAALLASPAIAADPIQIGVSGNLSTGLTTDWQDGDTSAAAGANPGNLQNAGVNVIQDWNINFTGSTTLENGLEIGVFLQLDRGGNAQQDASEDEVFASISGGFGTFLVGTVDEIGAKWGETGSINGGSKFDLDDGTFEVVSSGSVTASPLNRDVFTANNSASIAYVSPTFAGFTAGVSYSPDAGNSSGRAGASQADASVEDAWSFGLNYANSFGAVDVNIGAGLTMANAQPIATRDHFALGAGIEVGFAGFTVAGGWSQMEGPAGTVNGGYGQQGTASLGIGYSFDKVGVAVTGMYGYGDNILNGANSPDTVTADLDYSSTDRAWGVQLDGSYALGPGITWGAAFGVSDHTFGTAARRNSANNAIDDLTSYGIGTSLDIKF